MSTVDVSRVDQVFRTGFWMRPVKVLHDVSLEVPRGAVFGFLGENGAGKTTLIHLIAGLRRPTAGTVRIDGIDAVLPEARARIGYLPERPYFHEHLTGEGLLRYFGALSGMSRPRLTSRIDEVLGVVGLTNAARLELRKYSKGMLQRVGIAQAILHDPGILILDEPMSGLDPVGRREMRELILRLAADGRTIFFSSHVIPDIEAICSRVAVIRRGRIVGSGSILELLSDGPVSTEIVYVKPGLDRTETLQVKAEEEVNSALEGLLASRARIISVVPHRPSLESLFGGPRA